MSDPDPVPRPSPSRPRLRAAWPWLVIALTVVPAVWHVVDFPDDLDPEFPRVERPTFNPMPPPAYRLAEPGDTIDRVGVYLAAGAVALAAVGLLRSGGRVGLWPTALGLALAAAWHASTPGPTFDGWHGLGWRAIRDPSAPQAERIFLTVALLELGLLVLANAAGMLGSYRRAWERSRELGVRWLLAASAVLVAARQVDLPGVEPAGYWQRWAFDWGVLAFVLALVRFVGGRERPRPRVRIAWTGAGVAAWTCVVATGMHVTWLHRPLDRLRAVEPGRIYISAMPRYEGLKVAYERHPFRTIINIFPEDTKQRSRFIEEEYRFVRERGIRYVEASARDNDSDAFLDRTLALAVDPDAWPILLHCHGSMDRSPGWMGIYRFLVQGRPLDEIMREIERHRGYRPKASITLLFNRVLAGRAPERYLDDPTGRRLIECANGVFLLPRSELSRLTQAPRLPGPGRTR